MTRPISRRKMLQVTSKAALASTLVPHIVFAKEETSSSFHGAVVGEPTAAKIGDKVLADGGNAIDAAIATAFAGGITSPSKSGIGGYGGHAIIALANGKVTTIEFNAMAPAAARPDMFPVDDKGKVKNLLNYHGWLAPGVPGTLAGLEMALTRYGTRSLRDILAPAIHLCEEGVVIPKTNGPDEASINDPRPESVLKNSGGATEKHRNALLAKLLRTLADRNSGDAFYRGDIAHTIAEAFRKHGGLVTEQDLASYHARELKPVSIEWNGFTIHSSPLASPGAQLLEAASILKELRWEKLSALERLHAKLEALRISWADRNQYFGDPDFIDVPIQLLLSRDYAQEMADKVRAALGKGTPVPLKTDSSTDEGTMNISAVDKHGNMIAITLTHGSTFGARVSVEEYGMVLGHGMWRFEPRPGHPNSVGPRKRPVHNMCPSAITRHNKPVLAVGAAGGTRIPNSIYEVLIDFAGLDLSMEEAMAALRLDTSGNTHVAVERGFPTEEQAFLKRIGYSVSNGASAYTSAVSFDIKTKECRGLSRGGIF